jgi:glycosyltransferase involved in cell wall biosynthesis
VGGFVGPGGAAAALARALRELLSDGDRRAELGRRARRRVEERFGLEPVGAALRSFLLQRDAM